MRIVDGRVATRKLRDANEMDFFKKAIVQSQLIACLKIRCFRILFKRGLDDLLVFVVQRTKKQNNPA